MRERIVLAYSSGLNTSSAIPWLTGIRDCTLATGTVCAHVFDAPEEFACEVILPTLKAGALYEARHPIGQAKECVTGIARVKLFKSQHTVIGHTSPPALSDHPLATCGRGDHFDHTAATAFITTSGLSLETAARKTGKGTSAIGAVVQA